MSRDMVTRVLSPKQALARLVEGNRRFAHNVRSLDSLSAPLRRDALVSAQFPFGIVLSCSDSRVPAEIVFDQGLGDLFVVRVAGNVVAPALVGSVEFAATTYACPLAIVMGHTRCGAVATTVDAIVSKSPAPSENIADIVERIGPAVRDVLGSAKTISRDELLERAVRTNVLFSLRQLRERSKILKRLVTEGRLVIVGAEYSLESGTVSFFDELAGG
jgi:carbonic anhydrase